MSPDNERLEAGDIAFEELRRELAAVSVSPQFADDVRARISDELDPLRAEFEGLEVSPGFAVGVRERIAQPQMSWTRWMRWQVVAPALAALLVASFAVPGFRGAEVPGLPADQIPRSTIARAPNPAAPEPSTPALRHPGTGSVGTSAPRHPGTASLRTTELRTQSPLNPATPEPKVSEVSLEVITNQPALLRRLYAQMDEADRAHVVQAAVTSLDVTAYEPGEIVVAPIEISPVVIKWLGEPMPVPGLWPLIFKAVAEAAERSEK